MHTVSKHLRSTQTNLKKNIDTNLKKKVQQLKHSFKTNIGNLSKVFLNNKKILQNLRSQWNTPPIYLFLSMEAVFQHFKTKDLMMIILITKKVFSI